MPLCSSWPNRLRKHQMTFRLWHVSYLHIYPINFIESSYIYRKVYQVSDLNKCFLLESHKNKQFFWHPSSLWTPGRSSMHIHNTSSWIPLEGRIRPNSISTNQLPFPLSAWKGATRCSGWNLPRQNGTTISEQTKSSEVLDFMYEKYDNCIRHHLTFTLLSSFTFNVI